MTFDEVKNETVQSFNFSSNKSVSKVLEVFENCILREVTLKETGKKTIDVIVMIIKEIRGELVSFEYSIDACLENTTIPEHWGVKRNECKDATV